MFCQKCGKQIHDNAAFCPYCGADANNGHTINNDSSFETELKKEKRRKYIPFLIIIGIILLIFPVKNSIEKAVVKSVAEDYLQKVKDGPDEETMDDIVVQLLYGATGSETVTNFLHGQITGEDVCDIYDAVMLHMSYQVKKVEKVEAGHYRIIIRVENMDNTTVASEAWRKFSERYTDGNILDALKQAKEDLLSDKSQTIAGFIIEASNDLYQQNKVGYMVSGTHIIDVRKTDNGWEPSFEQGMYTFILDCAGIPY